ncbi:histidine kinase [Sphingobium aromaticiconvertens]|uniref:histidine kinase n=1 Tax=Sphingobium aromaticiconvertens TaxID=365341 RepID=UPI003018A32B
MNQLRTPVQGHHVTAAELVRNFAHWRDIGARDPVLVTHHGRETHMLLGIDHYRKLSRMDRQQDKEGADARVRDLATSLHEGLILCMADFLIDVANPAALAMTRRRHEPIEGILLWDAIPELSNTLIEAHLRHSLTSGTRSAADIPSPFFPDSWLHVESFAFGEGVALLLRDISQDVSQHRLADAKTAMLRAMEVHGGVAYARLSARGFIDFINPGFCTLIGLPEERLRQIPLPDLADVASRAPLREGLEGVLRGEGDRLLRAALLTNRGELVSVDIALVRLQGTYGTEGAMAILTRA